MFGAVEAASSRPSVPVSLPSENGSESSRKKGLGSIFKRAINKASGKPVKENEEIHHAVFLDPLTFITNYGKAKRSKIS